MVYCLGIAVIDFVFHCDEIPTKATKYKANGVNTAVGGGATNAAIAIAKLGAKVDLASRLGDDAFADLITTKLRDEGVGTSQLHRSQNGQSSYSSIVVDQSGERQIVNFRGDALTDRTDWISPSAQTRAILADTRWPTGMHAAMKIAKERNIPGIIDVDTPFDECDLSLASHLAFARPALAELTGTNDLEDGLITAAQNGQWVCATDGADGCYTLKNGQLMHIKAPKVEAKDTLGAGDVWHGAFALALAQGRPEEEACQFANITAALKCTKIGVAKGMPDRSTVEKMMNGTQT